MGDDAPLSNGVLAEILRGNLVPKPILQVLNMKKIQTQPGSSERYRVQMSDGLNFQPCMIATQINEKINSGELHKFCVIQLDKYICNTVHDRKIIIIVNTTVLKRAGDVGNIAIGQPKLLNLVHTDEPASGPGQVSNAGTNEAGSGRFKGQVSGSGGGPPQQQGYRQDNFTSNAVGSKPRGAYHNAAPPTRPGFGNSSAMTSPGGTPLSSRNIIPITGLNPYQNKWTIKVRVSSKPAIRTWSNSRGDGKVFNVDLVDTSGDVRACAFNELAEKMHNLFELGKVYYISRGRLKPANKQFNTTSSEYEISLNEDSEVELCSDVDTSLPSVQYNFVPIANLEAVEPNALIDVIGVCKTISDLSSIITKTTNRKVSKREIQLVDRSHCVVSSTLWGAEAEGFDGSKFPVIAIKGAKVSDFGGRSLNVSFNSVIYLNPDIPEAHQLRGWYDNVGKNEEAISISDTRSGGSMQTPYLSLSQVKELDLGHKEKPDYFSFKGTVIFAKKDNCLYKACPNPECNKKVTEDTTAGQYFCEKCNQGSSEFKYRMILMINTADHSDNQWMTCFQDTGSEIVGVPADELGRLRDTDEPAFDLVFQKVNFKDYVFKSRAKVDTYNDEQRLKCYCVSVSPIDFVSETRRCVKQIKEMLG